MEAQQTMNQQQKNYRQPKPRGGLDILNPYKPSVLFVRHRQTVQTQIRRRNTLRLLRVSTVCLQNVQ